MSIINILGDMEVIYHRQEIINELIKNIKPIVGKAPPPLPKNAIPKGPPQGQDIQMGPLEQKIEELYGYKSPSLLQKFLINLQKLDVDKRLIIFDPEYQGIVDRLKEKTKSNLINVISKQIIDCTQANYGLQPLRANVGGTALAYPIFASYDGHLGQGIYFVKLFLISETDAIAKKLKPYQQAQNELLIFNEVNKILDKPHIIKAISHDKACNTNQFENLHITIDGQNETVKFGDMVKTNCEITKHKIIKDNLKKYYDQFKQPMNGSFNITVSSPIKPEPSDEPKNNKVIVSRILGSKLVDNVSTLTDWFNDPKKNEMKMINFIDNLLQQKDKYFNVTHQDNPVNIQKITLKSLPNDNKLLKDISVSKDGSGDEIILTFNKRLPNSTIKIGNILDEITGIDIQLNIVKGQKPYTIAILGPEHIYPSEEQQINNKINTFKVDKQEAKNVRFCVEDKIWKSKYSIKFLFMEYMLHGTLCENIQNMNDKDLFDCVIPILFQLEVLVRNNIYHGDCHVNNIMFTKDDNYDPSVQKYYKYSINDMNLYIPVKDKIVKIIDFDKSIIIPKNIPGQLTDAEKLLKYYYDPIMELFQKINKEREGFTFIPKQKNIKPFELKFDQQNDKDIAKIKAQSLADILKLNIRNIITLVKELFEVMELLYNEYSKSQFYNENISDKLYILKNRDIPQKIEISKQEAENILKDAIQSNPKNQTELNKNIIDSCKKKMSEYIKNNLFTPQDVQDIETIGNQIMNFIEACKKFSSLYNKNIVITPGDINFFLISLHRTLINSREGKMTSRGWDRMQHHYARSGIDNILNYKITNEQKCQNAPKIKPTLHSDIENIIRISAQIGQVTKNDKNTRIDIPINTEGKSMIESWSKMDASGKLVNYDQPIHQGSFADFMILIKDYLEQYGYYKKPNVTDAQILQLIKI